MADSSDLTPLEWMGGSVRSWSPGRRRSATRSATTTVTMTFPPVRNSTSRRTDGSSGSPAPTSACCAPSRWCIACRPSGSGTAPGTWTPSRRHRLGPVAGRETGRQAILHLASSVQPFCRLRHRRGRPEGNPASPGSPSKAQRTSSSNATPADTSDAAGRAAAVARPDREAVDGHPVPAGRASPLADGGQEHKDDLSNPT